MYLEATRKQQSQVIEVTFREMIKLLASYNDKVAQVVLENAPHNAKYTSHHIQKEILHIFSRKVRSHIREEIGDSKFCIIVDDIDSKVKGGWLAKSIERYGILL